LNHKIYSVLCDFLCKNSRCNLSNKKAAIK
jgi:hypothetical protein